VQVSLEIASDIDHNDMIASVVCNAVPRVGEHILLLNCEARGRYYVTGIEHCLDPSRIEPVQHVCVYVVIPPQQP
jgi:hypothetical protein